MEELISTKKVLYVDMDNVLVDFPSGIARLSPEDRQRYEDDLDEAPGIFALMDPIDGAIEAYNELAQVYDTYILSTAPWKNPSAWSDKLLWVQKHFGVEKGTPAWKRVILSHHKHLNQGAIIIDDRIHNGVHQFQGIHIRFGSERFPDWPTVTEELLRLADSGREVRPTECPPPVLHYRNERHNPGSANTMIARRNRRGIREALFAAPPVSPLQEVTKELDQRRAARALACVAIRESLRVSIKAEDRLADDTLRSHQRSAVSHLCRFSPYGVSTGASR